MENAITDIWFTTSVSLQDLATALGLLHPEFDGENYWHWVIGRCQGYAIDVTRTHRKPAAETPTRIFMAHSRGAFPEKVTTFLLRELRQMEICPVKLGQWRYLRGNEFEMICLRSVF